MRLTVFIWTILIALCLNNPEAQATDLKDFEHIVVIYQENHSFDNLFGLWGRVGKDVVDGLQNADPAHTIQARQGGIFAFFCLAQNDVNLQSPSPLPAKCTDFAFKSAFRNTPFKIEDYIAPSDRTCPATGHPRYGVPKNQVGALPGGCTRDLVHRFYNEQYQINKGRQNLYVTGSDANGLVMGYYDTTQLPIFKFLHTRGAPNYVIADRFFQAAYGGSFLNHQWLAAARTPVFVNAANDGGPKDLHALVDVNGMPVNTDFYKSPETAITTTDPTNLTASCKPPAGRPSTPAGIVCGDYAVNTIQPFYWPYDPSRAAWERLPPLTYDTLGDRLSAKNIDWAWYSGGWSNANGYVDQPGWTNGHGPQCLDPHIEEPKPSFPKCPNNEFQYHHQPYNYFAKYAPGTRDRQLHLRDEEEFLNLAKKGKLKPVSFVKAIGQDNEHPGYASVALSGNHLVNTLRAILDGPNPRTLIIVTYDEFGGAWDHVPPPRYNPNGKVFDQWGPGTRIPAVLLSKDFHQSGVDHTFYDTTSVLKLIEDRFSLVPLTNRDAHVTSLAEAVKKAE